VLKLPTTPVLSSPLPYISLPPFSTLPIPISHPLFLSLFPPSYSFLLPPFLFLPFCPLLHSLSPARNYGERYISFPSGVLGRARPGRRSILPVPFLKTRLVTTDLVIYPMPMVTAVTQQYKFGTGASWEGNRSLSSVALAMRHRQ